VNVLSIEGLTVEFDGDDGIVRAVDDVSFAIPASRTVALVGESGSGKSVISQAIMGLLPSKARIVGGRILFRDPNGGEPVDIAALDRKGDKYAGHLRGNKHGNHLPGADDVAVTAPHHR
jgi:peptide/nickel transport system ATP-binding protein